MELFTFVNSDGEQAGWELDHQSWGRISLSVSATGADEDLERRKIKGFATGEDLCYVQGSAMPISDGYLACTLQVAEA